MPYLIDGHNLIGRLPDLSLDDPNDEAILVQKLTAFAARTNKKCTVVFDNGLTGGQSRMSTGKIKVIFATPRQTADAVMMQRIKKIPDPKNWTAVSSDNAVLNAASKRGMQTLKSAAFAGLLKAPEKPAEDENPDVYVSPAEVQEWLKLFGAGK